MEQEKKGLNVEESFNLVVSLARKAKLSYDEHALVDKAVNKVLEELNKDKESDD